VYQSAPDRIQHKGAQFFLQGMAIAESLAHRVTLF
jgi:hypothetical protein